MNIYKCLECLDVFKNKYTLQQHLRKKHDYTFLRKELIRNFKCNICGKMFVMKNAMQKHMEKFHQVHFDHSKSKRKLFCCFEDCLLNFGSYKEYREHLLREHSLEIKLYEVEFKSLEDFKRWKHQVEKQSKTCYSLDTAPKTLNDGTVKKYYNCHRSYKYKPKHDAGAINIGKACPSRIELSMTNYDDVLSIKVKFYSTHCGHFCEEVEDDYQSENSDVVITEVSPVLEDEFPNMVPEHENVTQLTEVDELIEEENDITSHESVDVINDNVDENTNEASDYLIEETSTDFKPVEELNINEIFVRCRTCLSTETSKVYTYVTESCTNDRTIHNAILSIVPELKVEMCDDDLVCNDCLLQLRDTMSFIGKCLDADTLLLQSLEATHEKYDPTMNDNDIEENDVHEEDALYENDSLIENTSELGVDDNPAITKEIEYWNNCSNYFKSQQNKIEPQIIRTLDNVDLGNYDEIITIGSVNNSLVSEFVDKVRKKIYIVKHTNFKGAQKILLLGTQFYRDCPVCEKLFDSEDSLNNHFEEEHKNASKIYLIKPYRLIPNVNSMLCSLCNKTFTSVGLKRKHALTCSLLNCPYCNQTFTEDHFNIHFENVHAEHFPFNCYKCNDKFFHFRLFKLHRCQHGNIKNEQKARQEEVIKKKCWFCKELFSLEDYNNHLEANHMKFVCSTCGLKFLTKNALKNHNSIHEKELCSHCGKMISKSYFNNHVQSKHNEDPDKMYKCTLCPKSYNNSLNLKTHIRRTHSYSICELCGVKCRTSYMKYHYINKHGGSKEFICHICSKDFSKKNYLERHLGEVHGIKNKYSAAKSQEVHKPKKKIAYIYPNDPLYCKFCQKHFKYISTLKLHIEKVHFKLYRYKCKYCDLSYVTKSQRNKHEKQHDDLSLQYRCNTCWKRFSTSEELDAHESSMHSRKFQCNYCDKCFSRQFAFNAHLIDTHMEEDVFLKEKENLLLESLSEFKVKTYTEEDKLIEEMETI